MFRDIVQKILKESKLLSSDSNNRKIFTTTRLEDIFIYCKNTESGIRAYYDIKKNLYFYSFAYDFIHFDIAQEAYFQGLYPEYNEDRSKLQGIHIVDKQAFCFVVVPYFDEEDIKTYDDYWQEDGYTLSKTITSAGVKVYWRTNEDSHGFPSEQWAKKLFGGLK